VLILDKEVWPRAKTANCSCALTSCHFLFPSAEVFLKGSLVKKLYLVVEFYLSHHTHIFTLWLQPTANVLLKNRDSRCRS